ncbi:MAG: sugar ABC transporter substrate-binding protein [Candidatus Nealsonbacteria bacterium]|nr:MAG: sugar ABC transporter substrate-binding protein [Candidatus Nealsonbacteria bacterium]
MKKYFVVLVSLLILLMFSNLIAMAEGKPLIGISVVGTEHNWDINAYNGAISKAKELGAEVISFSGEKRAEKQLSDIQTLISRNVDALIVILGYGKVIEPAIKQAREKGIPVVTADFTTPYSLCNVSTNNFSAEAELALKLVSDLKGNGEVGIFYVPGYPIEELRKDVFDTVLKWYPDVKIVAKEAEVEPGTVPDAYNKTKDILKSHPEIDALWAIYDMPMIGAAQAIVDMGLAGKVSCYGFDGDPIAMKMIMDPNSAFEATVAQQPYKIGQTVAEVAMDIINGKEVPIMKFVPAILVTRDNVEEVYHSLEKYKE